MSHKTKMEDYNNRIKQFQPKPATILNCSKAFLIGGLICLVGQFIQDLYIKIFHYPEFVAVNLMIATLILIASVLTGFGVYDKIGSFAGAGSLVLVTGFANSMTSAAMEYRTEGIVLGIASNLFKIAGSVIVFGVVATYVMVIILYVISVSFS